MIPGFPIPCFKDSPVTMSVDTIYERFSYTCTDLKTSLEWPYDLRENNIFMVTSPED